MTFVDPYAPYDSPHHPVNVGLGARYANPPATPEEKAAAEHWLTLFLKHQTPAESKADLVPDLEELERRETLANEWTADGEPIDITDLTGTVMRYDGDLISGETNGWVQPADPTPAVAPELAEQPASKATGKRSGASAGKDTTPDLDAALSALDAAKESQ